MVTIAQVSGALQRVLTETAEAAARATGCVQRVRKFDGATWVQTLVFGFLAHPTASLDALCQLAAVRGVAVTPQAIASRFSPAAAACLEQVLTAAVREAIASDPAALPLLDRFTAVVVQDSTSLRLPDSLADRWRGCGGGDASETGTRAALKLQVGLDLRGGRLQGPTLHAGRQHDHATALDLDVWGPGTLVLRDLGYFCLETLAAQTTAGHWWVTRPKVNTAIQAADGTATTLATLVGAMPSRVPAGTTLDQPIQLGRRPQLPCRLVAVRLPAVSAAAQRRKVRDEATRHGRAPSRDRLAVADWFIVVTNLPGTQATATDVLVLARVRWQIELVFRRWKSVGRLDESRSGQPWRILCEVYAKLIGLLVAHWVTLTGAWTLPNRSLWKALAVVQTHAPDLARSFDDTAARAAALATIAQVQRTTCRLTRRRARPALFQLLSSPQVA